MFVYVYVYVYVYTKRLVQDAFGVSGPDVPGVQSASVSEVQARDEVIQPSNMAA